MHIFDILNAWLNSMALRLDSAKVIARFERSPVDRPNPSCVLNLRRCDHELDAVIWSSGEAELTIGEINGPITQIHIADTRSQTGLAELLSCLVEFVEANRP